MTKMDPDKQLVFIRPSDGVSDDRWMVDRYNGRGEWASTIPCKNRVTARRKRKQLYNAWNYQKHKEPSE